MPQPRTSSHLPSLRFTSTSAEGSVNGKNEGRKLHFNFFFKEVTKEIVKNAFKLCEVYVPHQLTYLPLGGTLACEFDRSRYGKHDPSNEAERRFAVFHRTDLNTRSVRT